MKEEFCSCKEALPLELGQETTCTVKMSKGAVSSSASSEFPDDVLIVHNGLSDLRVTGPANFQ